MIWAFILAAVATGMAQSEVPTGRAQFGGMSDLEIDGWLRWNGFYHATNVYRCGGLAHQASARRLTRALGRDYEARHAAIRQMLRARHGDNYVENAHFLAIGYGVNPAYCRRIRFVVSDMLRGTALLEQRLGIVR